MKGTRRVWLVGILGAILLIVFPKASEAMVVSVSFDRAYASADIVCVADAIEVIPAPEATEQVPRTVESYRLRVIHVWKGSPPDTMVLDGGRGRALDREGRPLVWMIACGGPPRFVVGRRYLTFVRNRPPGELPFAETHTGRIDAAGGDMIQLQRKIGPGRCVAPDVAPIPSFSYRSLVERLEHGDSLQQMGAISAFRLELTDSSGFVVPALVRTMRHTWPPLIRRYASGILADWAKDDGRARRAFCEALEGNDPNIRLLAAETQIQNGDKKLQRRVLKRRADPDPRVRAAALLRCAVLLKGEHPPIREYREALTDGAAIVRIEAIYGLEARAGDPDIKAALEERFADPDSEVAAVARKVVGRIGQRKW